MERSSASATYKLPLHIVTPTDVTRVSHELEELDAYLESQRLREAGKPMARLPKTSRLLDELVALNELNLLHATARRELQAYLQELHERAPRMHISFAAEPSAAVLQKVASWLRQNISATVLISVGLQPNIVAGCVLRTTNRYFDMSLQKHLHERRKFLIDALSEQPEQQPVASVQSPEVVHG